MDVETLSRIQFALTAGFHFLFPPISIGFAVFIVIIEALWLKTGDIKYQNAAKFFLKLFGMIFAVGVVTGIVMVFQFGTNWPIYSGFVGDVFGSPLAIEAVFAFFMESTFLGIALFGWNRIGQKAHFFATFMVMVGSHLSALRSPSSLPSSISFPQYGHCIITFPSQNFVIYCMGHSRQNGVWRYRPPPTRYAGLG